MPGIASNGSRSSRCCPLLCAVLLATGLQASASPAVDPACEPLDEPEFFVLVERARTFIEQDRPTSHADVAETLEQRIPCLVFVPAPDVWAGYLVGLAAVRHLKGGDWQGPLAAAVRAVPDIDRGVNANHEMGRWTPPPAPPPSGPVPEGASLFVDGVREPDIPVLEGLHLVQVRTWGGELRSALVNDAQVPTDWFEHDGGGLVLAPQLRASIVGGAAASAQTLERADGGRSGLRTYGPDLGVAVGVQLGRPVGVQLDVLATTALLSDRTSLRLDGSVLLVAGSPRIHGGLGIAGALSERTVEAEVFRSSHVVPAAGVGLVVGPEDGVELDAGLVGGWTPAFGRGALTVGIAPPGPRLRVRFGLQGRLRTARFVRLDTGLGRATNDLALLAEVGLLSRTGPR